MDEIGDAIMQLRADRSHIGIRGCSGQKAHREDKVFDAMLVIYGSQKISGCLFT